MLIFIMEVEVPLSEKYRVSVNEALHDTQLTRKFWSRRTKLERMLDIDYGEPLLD